VDVNHRVESEAIIGLPPEEILARHHAVSQRLVEIRTALEAKQKDAERDALGVAWADDANMPKRPM
jgi:hypothetical protein